MHIYYFSDFFPLQVITKYCAKQQVLVVYLFYIQQCVYVNSKLLIFPSPLSPLVTVSLSSMSVGWWECKLVQPLRRTVWRFLKKLKIELPCDPAIPLLGLYLEKTIIQKDTRTPVFIAALFTIVKTRKQPKCPSADEWIKKMWYMYIQWNISHKKMK